MKYISTRGIAPKLSFEDAVLAGLATDGGLYVPENVPALSMAEITAMQSLSYPDLAYNIISRFTGNNIAPEALKRIINESYKTFCHAAVAPLKQLDSNTYLLELFHGETLAFKDFALQFLGRLLDHILEKRKQKVVVIGATSGDTGSAAIAGCRGRKNMDIFILYPHGRVSDVCDLHGVEIWLQRAHLGHCFRTQQIRDRAAYAEHGLRRQRLEQGRHVRRRRVG